MLRLNSTNKRWFWHVRRKNDIYFNLDYNYSEEERAKIVANAKILPTDGDLVKGLKIAAEELKACSEFRKKYEKYAHEREIYDSGVEYGIDYGRIKHGLKWLKVFYSPKCLLKRLHSIVAFHIEKSKI